MPFKVMGQEYRLPISGGGYLRLFPAELLKSGIQRINKIERQPAVLYFHPWEIDPDQPRIKAGLKSRFRHYLNLQRTEGKLCHLFKGIKFTAMADVINVCDVGWRGQVAQGFFT
jgi:hypothetical protein